MFDIHCLFKPLIFAGGGAPEDPGLRLRLDVTGCAEGEPTDPVASCTSARQPSAHQPLSYRHNQIRSVSHDTSNYVNYPMRSSHNKNCISDFNADRGKYMDMHRSWSDGSDVLQSVTMLPSYRPTYLSSTYEKENEGDAVDSCGHLSSISHQPSPTQSNNQPTMCEKVVVLRLPGERLGLGLKFDGGWGVRQLVRRVFIESIAVDSPGSRASLPWGQLCSGDQILNIEGLPVSSMTRLQCVAALRDSHVKVTIGILKGDGVIPPLDDGPGSYRQDEEDHYSRGKSNSFSSYEDRKKLPPPPLPPRSDLNYSQNPARPPVESTTPVDIAEEPPQYFVPEVPQVPLPPAAAIYLDLLAEEEERRARCGSESDETGSSASTVIDRLSLSSSTTVSRNSSFNASAAVDNAKYSRFDLASALSQFEMLEREFERESSPVALSGLNPSTAVLNETYPSVSATLGLRGRRHLIRSLSLSPGTYKDQFNKIQLKNEEVRLNKSRHSVKSLSFSLKKRPFSWTPIQQPDSPLKRTRSFSGRNANRLQHIPNDDNGNVKPFASANEIMEPLSINTTVGSTSSRSQDSSPDSGIKSATEPNSLSSNDSADFSPNESTNTSDNEPSYLVDVSDRNNSSIASKHHGIIDEETFSKNVPLDSSPKDSSRELARHRRQLPSTHLSVGGSPDNTLCVTHKNKTADTTESKNLTTYKSCNQFKLRGNERFNNSSENNPESSNRFDENYFRGNGNVDVFTSNDNVKHDLGIVTVKQVNNVEQSQHRVISSPVTVIDSLPFETDIKATEQQVAIGPDDNSKSRCYHSKFNKGSLVDKFDRIANEFYLNIDKELEKSFDHSDNVSNEYYLIENENSDKSSFTSSLHPKTLLRSKLSGTSTTNNLSCNELLTPVPTSSVNDDRQSVPSSSVSDDCQSVPTSSVTDDRQSVPTSSVGDDRKSVPTSSVGDDRQSVPSSSVSDYRQSVPTSSVSEIFARRNRTPASSRAARPLSTSATQLLSPNLTTGTLQSLTQTSVTFSTIPMVSRNTNRIINTSSQAIYEHKTNVATNVATNVVTDPQSILPSSTTSNVPGVVKRHALDFYENKFTSREETTEMGARDKLSKLKVNAFSGFHNQMKTNATVEKLADVSPECIVKTPDNREINVKKLAVKSFQTPTRLSFQRFMTRELELAEQDFPNFSNQIKLTPTTSTDNSLTTADELSAASILSPSISFRDRTTNESSRPTDTISAYQRWLVNNDVTFVDDVTNDLTSNLPIKSSNISSQPQLPTSTKVETLKNHTSSSMQPKYGRNSDLDSYALDAGSQLKPKSSIEATSAAPSSSTTPISFRQITRTTRLREDLGEIIKKDLAEKFKTGIDSGNLLLKYLPGGDEDSDCGGFEVEVEEQEEIERVLECDNQTEVDMVIAAFRDAGTVTGSEIDAEPFKYV